MGTCTESTLSGLFAVCLYSNISFMQSSAETLCVVPFSPACGADGREWLPCCLFDFIFQHWSVLLIIQPDYENSSESRRIEISTRRYDKMSWANAHVNSLAEWIEGYYDVICLYFIILFSGLCYKQLEVHGLNQGGGFRLFWSLRLLQIMHQAQSQLTIEQLNKVDKFLLISCRIFVFQPSITASFTNELSLSVLYSLE